jgi:hypothetical protein
MMHTVMKACGSLKVNFLSSEARADPPEFTKYFVWQGTIVKVGRREPKSPRKRQQM